MNGAQFEIAFPPPEPRDGCGCPGCVRLRKERIAKAAAERPRPTAAVRQATAEALRRKQGGAA